MAEGRGAHRPKGSHNVRRDLLAIKNLERLGLDPMQELADALAFAKDMTKKGGNVNREGGSDQVAFLALWVKSAEVLMKYRYPQLSALAITDLSSNGHEKTPITSAQAIELLRKDPFFPKEVTEGDIVSAMKSNLTTPALPLGTGHLKLEPDDK